MRHMRWVLVLSFALGGCAATAPNTISQAGLSPKRVAVASIVGETATLKYIGLTVFTNKQRYLPTRTWNLDGKLEAALVRALSGSPGRSFVALPLDRDSLLSGYNSQKLRPDWSVLVPKLVDVARTQQADALLLVTTGVLDYNFGEGQPFSGLGIMSRGAFGAHPNFVVAYLSARLQLIDVNSAKTVAERPAGVKLDITQFGSYPAPALSLEPKNWYTDFDEITPTQQAELAQGFELMSQAILANAQRFFGLR